MPELFLLVAMMVATLLLLAGLMVVFRGWMQQRDAIMGGTSHDHHGGAGGH